ncbi:MAG: hypothetical protein ABA06_02925 [Parcubacteria bacterium C7867-001]|nr:MAG: hypothetical protein ABA06_02925 [Parcubacteria bacterium C7867-001]
MTIEKYKNVAIGTLALLLLTSLYFNFENRTTSATEKVATVSQDELFQKKQECQGYQTSIEAKLKTLDFYNPDTNYQTTHFLKEIFFSPKANTCLYIEQEWGLQNNKLVDEIYTLNDALTGEILTSSIQDKTNSNYLQQKQGFEDFVSEYK